MKQDSARAQAWASVPMSPLELSSAAVSYRIWHKTVITSGLMCRSCSSSTAAASCIALSWANLTLMTVCGIVRWSLITNRCEPTAVPSSAAVGSRGTIPLGRKP